MCFKVVVTLLPLERTYPDFKLIQVFGSELSTLKSDPFPTFPE